MGIRHFMSVHWLWRAILRRRAARLAGSGGSCAAGGRGLLALLCEGNRRTQKERCYERENALYPHVRGKPIVRSRPSAMGRVIGAPRPRNTHIRFSILAGRSEVKNVGLTRVCWQPISHLVVVPSFDDLRRVSNMRAWISGAAGMQLFFLFGAGEVGGVVGVA